MEDLKLVKAGLDYEAAYMDYITDWEQSGEDARGRRFEAARQDFRGHIAVLDRESRGADIPPGRVPHSTFWLIKDGTIIVGEVRIRHSLNAFLEHHGGHIGYDIRPSYRGRGYGTVQLALTLEKARDLGLHRVMVTCDVDNRASARVIEKNGGVLASQGISDVTGRLISRYWIDIRGDIPG